MQLRLWYRELHKKQAEGTFDADDTFNWVYVCTELGRFGYVLNKDESDWSLPPQQMKMSNNCWIDLDLLY